MRRRDQQQLISGGLKAFEGFLLCIHLGSAARFIPGQSVSPHSLRLNQKYAMSSSQDIGAVMP